MLIVTGTQLADFLPNGKYGQVQPPDIQASLQHCSLNNLLGENVFGELDFRMNKSEKARHMS